MAGFGQAEWQRATTWEGELPGPGVLWELLHAPELSEAFRAAADRSVASSRLMRAGLAQHLSRQGASGEEVAQGVGDITGRRHAARIIEPLLALELRPSAWKIRFTNLVSARFTEVVFERAFRPVLERLGLTLDEDVAQRNFLDYRITHPGTGFALAVNLKNAGIQYRDARRWVGLEPEDTLPIATYKIFGSEAAGIPSLIYVYLVDWTLLERLRLSYWDALSERERAAFQLLASTLAVPRHVEDRFIECTVRDRLDHLVDAVGYAREDLTGLPFRAISAGRCRRLFYDNHERSPYVYRQRMNTDPNVHISVAAETTAFSDFVDRYLSSEEARARLLHELSITAQVTIPAPPI